MIPPFLAAAILFFLLWGLSSTGSASITNDTSQASVTTSPQPPEIAGPTTAAPSTTTPPTTTAPTTTAAPTTTVAPTTTASTTTTLAPLENPAAIFVAEGRTGAAPGPGVRTYRVEVEAATRFDPTEVAAFVDDVLADSRSWSANGSAPLGRTDGDLPAGGFRIIFASPDTVDFLCHPLDTAGYFSCRNGGNVVLNAERWTNAVDNWETSLTEYRQYLVNHEVGHALGFGHVDCPGAGQLAPVMMQQSKTIGACAPNSWPFPAPA